MAAQVQTTQQALTRWAEADNDSRDRITNVLDVVMEAADDLTGPLMVTARDILDAAADRELRVAGADEELLVAATDIGPAKVVSLLFLVLEVVPMDDVVAAGELLELLAAQWTPQERRAVADWAAAVHVHASDNPNVPIPERPAVVEPLLDAPAAASRTSLNAARRALVQRLARDARSALVALERQLQSLELPEHARPRRKAREMEAELRQFAGSEPAGSAS